MPGRIWLKRGRGVRRRHQPGTMNGLEREYSLYLDVLKARGEILAWWFEGVKLKLADKCYYTVDFLVMLPDGTLEGREVKGAKKKPNGEEGYWVEDDAKVKIKIAAEMFPFTFRIVFKSKTEGWKMEEI